MSNDNPQTLATINPEGVGSRITATYWDRDVDVYSVFDHELKSIKSSAANSGLYIGFFGVAFGAMLTLLVVLLTVEINSPWLFASFVLCFVGSCLATLLLGIKAWLEFRESGRQLDYIETRSRSKKITQTVTALRVSSKEAEY